jgi:hypothetical protein
MLASDASIQCWGFDGYGNLGDGSTTNAFVPVAATQFNTGSANVQLIASVDTTLVDIELIFPWFLFECCFGDVEPILS